MEKQEKNSIKFIKNLLVKEFLFNTWSGCLNYCCGPCDTL